MSEILVPWDEERIEQELAERSAPAIITVSAAKEVVLELQESYIAVVTDLEEQLAGAEALIEDLQEEIEALENPADVVVTIAEQSFGVSQYVTAMQDVDAALRTGSALARDRLAGQMTVIGTHCMNFGAPNLWPNEADGRITNWQRLDQRLNMFLEMGVEPAMIFYNYPVWQKEIVGKGGVCTPTNPADPFATDGRVMPAKYDKFRQYCYEVATRYLKDPYHVKIMIFGNEFKGYYFTRDGSDGLDYKDYTEHYNIWVEAVEAAAAALSLDPLSLKLGGCYAPVRCEATASKETYAEGEVYGYFRKSPFESIQYFLDHASRIDFVCFDMGSGNAVGPELTDTFTVQQHKWADAALRIRAMTDLPMVITETYAKCADDQNANAQRACAAKMVAHLEIVSAGYWMAWAWGAIGQGEYHEINKNGGLLKDYVTGDTNPWYEAHGLIKQFFSSGAPLFEVQVEGEGVYAKATDKVLVLVNMTENTRDVRWGEFVVPLAPYEVLSLPR